MVGGPDNKGPCFVNPDFCCSSCVNHLLAMFNILLDYQIVLRNYLFARMFNVMSHDKENEAGG